MKIDKEKFDHVFEIVTAILLGITALLTSYASWQGSLYGGNQSTKYTKGSAMVQEANSLFSDATNSLNSDMQIYNEINDMRIDLTFATEKGNQDDIDRLTWKLNEMYTNSVSQELSDAIDWSDAQEEYVSPFEMEGFAESYFTDASQMYSDGYAMIEDGQDDNHKGDVLGLSTVIYSIVLFLLGIVGTFKSDKLKVVIAAVSVVALIFALVTMVSIPMITL